MTRSNWYFQSEFFIILILISDSSAAIYSPYWDDVRSWCPWSRNNVLYREIWQSFTAAIATEIAYIFRVKSDAPSRSISMNSSIWSRSLRRRWVFSNYPIWQSHVFLCWSLCMTITILGREIHKGHDVLPYLVSSAAWIRSDVRFICV